MATETDTGGVSADRLRSFVERAESVEQEIKDSQDALKEVFSEAKSDGFCVKTIRQLIKLRAMQPHARAEAEEMLETYKAALGMV